MLWLETCLEMKSHAQYVSVRPLICVISVAIMASAESAWTIGLHKVETTNAPCVGGLYVSPFGTQLLTWGLRS